MRYIPNKLPDFIAGKTVVAVNKEDLVSKAISTLQNCITHCAPSKKTHNGGLYIGFPGIAYACLHVARVPACQPHKEQLLAWATQIMQEESKYTYCRDDHDAYLLGALGVVMLRALLAWHSGDTDKAWQHAQEYLQNAPRQLKNFSDETLAGRAGFLFGIVVMAQTFGGEFANQLMSSKQVEQVWMATVDSGRRYASVKKHPSPLMYNYYETEYLGAAHGLVGIVVALMHFPHLMERNPQATGLIRGTIDYLLQVTPRSTSNLPASVDEIGRHARPVLDELMHWCHGAPGAIHLYAKAYLHFHEATYLQAAKRCTDVVWERGILKKGPGICHGVGGNGYVFLAMYRLTGDQKYLHRALQFAEFVTTPEFLSQARCPDNPYSLFEGWAGTACFYADLTEPEKAIFPCFPVFG